MKPAEFVLWLNGAAELVGDQPPTPEQWATMREKLGEAVGELVAARLLERAEDAFHSDERWKKLEVMKREAIKHETLKQVLGLARARPAGTILEAPEMPKLHSPGLPNHILGKVTI